MPNPIRIFKLDAYDWWAGESLAACIAEARRQIPGAYPEAETEGRECTAWLASDAIAERLEREIADGTHFPCLFASTEW